MTQTLPPPVLEHVCDLTVTVAPAIEIGASCAGLRRVVPITGGSVRGPKLNGRVLAAGADFQMIVEGGTQAQLDARYVVELDDGCRIFVHNTALRVASAEDTLRLMQGQEVDPDRVYFRCQPRFEVAGSRWAWLTQSQFIGSGRRTPDAVWLSFYRVC